METFIKEFAALPNHFGDDRILFHISLQSDIYENDVCINIDIGSVPKNHSQYKNWVEHGSIELRHNKRLQGYLFSSSNFKDEEGGIKAIAEVLKFAYINNYYAILNYYKKHSDTYKEFIKDYTSGMVVESFIKKIIRE